MIFINSLKSILNKYSIFILLAILVVFSQLILLEPHLKYGFSDVDWGFLSIYKESKQREPNTIINFLKTLPNSGVYTHQTYYIGLQGDFFGLNFPAFQATTHVFKILATIAAYPLFLAITNSVLAAFIGTILFAFAYPAVGTMYTVVTSSDYTGVLVMNIFLFVYLRLIKKNEANWYWLIITLFLMLTTLFLSTERMYPILFWIFIIELFLIFYHKFSKKYLTVAIKRIGILFSPLIIVTIFSPRIYLDFLLGNGGGLVKNILAGDWQHFLRPFISMGSLIVPYNFWKYFGIVKIETFNNYLGYFVSGPMIIFMIATLAIAYLIIKRSIKFIIQMFISIFIMGVLAFIVSIHHTTHFDESFITPALIGGYLTIFGLISFFHWLKYQQKDNILLCLSIGLLFAWVYILLTWIGSDNYLTPSGVHRYLTVPALSICLSLGSLLTLMVRRLRRGRKLTRFIFFVPLLILIPIIIIGSSQITDFFNGQLKQGFGASDQQMMRRQLWGFLGSLSDQQPSLFYFDFSEDLDNGYYYDNTLFGGFGSWMLWHKNINFNRKLTPAIFWNNYDRLASSKTIRNGEIGFYTYEHFYPIANFYAFKLKDKKVVDIKKDILQELAIINNFEY